MSNSNIKVKGTHRRSRPLTHRIIAAVHRYGAGNRVFTPADFAPHLGNDVSVRKALSRLVADGKLVRLRQGLYFWPKVSKVLKVSVPPSPDAVVDAIARRDGVVIVPDNLVAANDVGVTNAVPAKPVYLTTGNPMTIHIGGQTITLKKASKPVAAVAKARVAAKVVQTLTWLGKKGASRAENIAALRKYVGTRGKLPPLPRLDSLPKWMRDIVCALLSSGAPRFA